MATVPQLLELGSNANGSDHIHQFHFWTERIGSAVGMKTLKLWNDTTLEYSNRGREKGTLNGKRSDRYELKILLRIASYFNIFVSRTDAIKYKTFITQEMLKKGFLVASFYACTEHSDYVLEAMHPTCTLYSKRLKNVKKAVISMTCWMERYAMLVSSD